MLASYKRGSALFKRDRYFTTDEILYIREVYAGMIEANIKNVDQLAFVIQALTTTMTDAQRMKIIDQANGRIEQQYRDMEQFTTENQVLSPRRAKDEQEILVVKSLYGL
ncbi:MAG: hypothetical protein H0X41_02480 [Chitinophagaceae bacterium]|nr:hypothetical protein [Chitinophagaceae bacterium]